MLSSAQNKVEILKKEHESFVELQRYIDQSMERNESVAVLISVVVIFQAKY